MTAAEFASRLGVKEATLRYWKWQLGHDRRAAGRRRARKLSPAAFVEVMAPSLLSATSVEPLELLLRNGLKVRIPAGFDAGTLRRILDTVEAR